MQSLRGANQRGNRTHGRWTQLLLTLSLLLSLLAPYLSVPTAVAQGTNPAPPPLPAPQRVAVIGSFQTALGCAADFDPTCQQTQLRDNRDGSWSAALPIPPGDYAFRIVASSDSDRSLGANGDPNGPDLQLSVPADAAGAYIAYDALTGEITAEPVNSLVTLQTDLGDQLAMAPTSDGGYAVTWDAQQGAYGFQVFMDGQPVTQDGVSLDSNERVLVAVDPSGAVTDKRTVPQTTLDVAAVDDSGAARPGSCFALFDEQDDLVSQQCDDDDRQPDGMVTLRVPNGLVDGSYELRETRTGDTGEAAAAQEIALGAGRFQTTAEAAGAGSEQTSEEGETTPAVETPSGSEQGSQQAQAGQPIVLPGDQPGRLTVVSTDASGQPLPGACFAILEFGFELCDEAGTGEVIFDAVPATPVTLRETVPPAGFITVPDLPITVDVNGVRLEVPHAASGEAASPDTDAGITPVETPQTAAGANEVVLTLRDRDGAAVTGACWSLTSRDSGQAFTQCDADDGADDGTLRFTDVPAGRYRLEETTTPAGFPPAEGQGLDVVDGAPAQVTIEYRRGNAEPGRLVLEVSDADGNPLPNTCFDLAGPLDLSDVCDNQDDGRLNIPDLPPGSYTVTQTRTADGFQTAQESTVDVPGGDTITLPIVNQRQGAEAGQETAPDAQNQGRLAITVRDDAGQPVANACATLSQPGGDISVCDNSERDSNPEPGQIAIADLVPGSYTVAIIPPEGATAPQPAAVNVVAGQTAALEFVVSGSAQTPTPPATNGNLAIRAEDAAGNPLPSACYVIEIPPGGQGFGPFCDDDGNGAVDIQGITPGPIAVLESTPPQDSAAANPTNQMIDIAAGETAQVTFTPGGQPQEQTTGGSVEITLTGGDGQPVAGCVRLSNDNQEIEVCDNDERDQDAGVGVLRLDDLQPGRYRLALTQLPGGDGALNEQEIEVKPGETTRLTFATASGPGTLVLFVEDEAGERLGGSCFTLRTGDEVLEDVCDQGDDGRLNIPDLEPGTYTITQTQAAEGRELAAEQTATVAPGQTTELTLRNPATAAPATPTVAPSATPEVTPEASATPETTPAPEATAEQQTPGGMFSVVNVAADSTVIGGGCFQISDASGAVVAALCDNDGGDFDSLPGVIAFGALPLGDYTLTQMSAPQGFSPAAPMAVTITADAQRLNVVNQPIPAEGGETGSVELQTFDDDGNAVPGQCYTLTGAGGTFGPFCDDGEGDTSGEPGILTVTGLPTGTYEATLQLSGEEPDVEQAQRADTRRSVSVKRGDRPTRASFRVRNQQNRRGDLMIRVRDQDGDALADACFALIPEGGNDRTQQVCDNDEGDRNSSAGRILITGLRVGRYTLTQTTAPTGFQAAADQQVRVQAGEVREVSVTNQRDRAATATLNVETVNRQGDLLPGACYALLLGNSSLEGCDSDTDSDGVTRFTDIAPGSYVVRQIQPPDGGFDTAGSTATLVNAGQEATVTVVNELRPGSLLLRKSDAAGAPLGGSCFALRRDDRSPYGACDNDSNDGDPAAGSILLNPVAPGVYTLRETQAPAGFLPAADQDVEIVGNQRTRINVANAPAPPPERVGDLRVFKVDVRGRALAGSCFALLDGNGRLVHPTCDADDGAGDGVVLITGVAIGDYTLRETRRPSADYEAAADRTVSISENVTTDVQVENRLRLGRLLIRKMNPNGAPLSGACFDLVEDSGGAGCTDVEGNLLFSGLVPGVYTIVETEAPAGFLIVAQIDPVTVRPGSTATVDIVDQPAPPPPDSGSLQVVKFLCPTTAGNGGVTIVDSSDPDGGGLARTAGCTLGDAAFALNGPSGPLEFRTGNTGRYQVTLPTGNYVLTELASGVSEDLVVSLNTLTTIVVVNAIEPEGEEPAIIAVRSYTCDPGFQGRVWADFAESCLREQALTNNVAYRISGPIAARRVTGDTGIGGTTQFTGLPPGSYRLRQETPAGVVAVYAFCGLDANAPTGRSVGDVLDLQVASGQQFTCAWFNVPEDLSGGFGAITVYKYACPITTPANGFDWYGRCDPQGQGVRFSLSRWDGQGYVPVTIGATDSDGILRVTQLQPGLYDLKEVDAVWCNAESDSVNAQGQVVVEAGKRASIWIFNCVGAKNPPNTGAGPMWSGASEAASAPLWPGGELLPGTWTSGPISHWLRQRAA